MILSRKLRKRLLPGRNKPLKLLRTRKRKKKKLETLQRSWKIYRKAKVRFKNN